MPYEETLFFDDSLLTRVRNLKRRWHEPAWLPDHLFIDPQSRSGSTFASVVPREDGGFYLFYSAAFADGKPDDSQAVCLAQSDNGFDWQRVSFCPPRKEGFPQVVYPGTPIANGAAVLYDPADPDPARRYKMTEACRGGERHCRLLYSPDGKSWTLDRDHPFQKRFSDTLLSLARNHWTGRYQITLRRHWVERRIYLTESADLKTWSEPKLILHPDPLDAPATQLYGMPHFRYGDLFIGFLWRYETCYDNPKWNALAGTVDTELVYSYNGLNWARTHRPFMARRERGEYGGGSMYGSGLLERESDLLIYANAALLEHHHYMSEPGDPPRVGILPGRLRKDGFASLSPEGGKGELTTDALYPRSPELSLNLKAPLGGVRVQICDPDCRPLPGYTFEECEEMRGDGLAMKPRWKEHHDLSAALTMLENRDIIPSKPGWLRIQIELE